MGLGGRLALRAQQKLPEDEFAVVEMMNARARDSVAGAAELMWRMGSNGGTYEEQFESDGDCFLGKLLCGVQPNS
jgi:hypothetical protein